MLFLLTSPQQKLWHAYQNNDDQLEILALSGNATAIYEGDDMIIKFASDAMITFWGKDRKVIGMPLEEAIPGASRSKPCCRKYGGPA